MTTFRLYIELRCLILSLLQTHVVIGIHTHNTIPLSRYRFNDHDTVLSNYWISREITEVYSGRRRKCNQHLQLPKKPLLYKHYYNAADTFKK